MADKKQSVSGGSKVKEEPKETLQNASDQMEKREKELKLDIDKDLKKLDDLKCMSKFLTIVFSILTVATGLSSVVLIAVATVSAVAASAMDAQDDSGRLVGLVVLSVTAATAIAVAIYAQIATCSKNKIRPIFVAAVVLMILPLIQAIIAGASVRVTPKDGHRIEQSLHDSFELARQHSPRHVKMWATTQHSLHCCGFRDAFDYRDNNLLPPDVPISCCPSYDPGRSDIVQEREREQCKARHEFYDNGCSGDVLLVITETAEWVFHVSIAVICFEFLAAIFGGLLVRYRKAHAAHDKDQNDDHHDPPNDLPK